MFDRWPTSGAPVPLGSRAVYDEVVDALVVTGSIPDASQLYWDIRPSDRFQTVEFRIADVCATVDETVMLAGLARSLTRTGHRQVVRDEPVDHPRPKQVMRAQVGKIDLAGPSVEAGSYRLHVGDAVATRRNHRELRTEWRTRLEKAASSSDRAVRREVLRP